MRLSEIYIIKLVRDGFFAIDENGFIWKRKKLSRTGRQIPIMPYRADKLRPDGYMQIIVGRKHYALSHRIIFACRNGLVSDGITINHKNGEKADNRPSNLELMTQAENNLHCINTIGRRSCPGERNGRSKLKYSDVEDIRKRCLRGESSRSIGKIYGISHRSVLNIKSRKRWSEYPKCPTT